MDKNQRAAYATLLDTAERMRALITAARSSTHPLVLDLSTQDALTAALENVKAAQRSMESVKC